MKAMRQVFSSLLLFLTLGIVFSSCGPKEPIVLRQIKDVVVDATTDPMLKAKAIFYNPNSTRGRLREIKVDIYVNGKKAGEIDQHLGMQIPSKQEFTVPLEVKLSLKEFGVLDTIFSMLGGKKFDVHYK